MTDTGRRVGGAMRVCLRGSTLNHCQLPLIRRQPVFLLNTPNLNGATVVRRITSRVKLNLIDCSVARRAHRDTLNLPIVMRGRCNNGRCRIDRCAVDRVVTDICSYVHAANGARNVLFLSRVGYISRALSPTVLLFLRCGIFNKRRVPRN